MAVKIRTGDLFLGNRWTIDGMFSQAMDREARWSDVGIFDVDNVLVTGTTADVNVFLMYDDYTKRVPLDTLLRDPILQFGAHRELLHKDRAVLSSNLKSAMNLNENQPKENMAVILQEFKGVPVERNGYTSAEIVGKTLSLAKITLSSAISSGASLNSKYYLSDFQERGMFDSIYGKETPLFSRRGKSEFSSEGLSIEKAKMEVQDIMKGYVRLIPLMVIDKYASSTSTSTSNNNTDNNNRQTVNVSLPDQIEYAGQSSNSQPANNVSLTRKQESNFRANVDGSIALRQRLMKMQEDKNAYSRSKPLP